MSAVDVLHAYGRRRPTRQTSNGHAFVKCPACFHLVRLAAGTPGVYEADELDAATEAITLHIIYGCKVASRDEDYETTLGHRTG